MFHKLCKIQERMKDFWWDFSGFESRFDVVNTINSHFWGGRGKKSGETRRKKKEKTLFHFNPARKETVIKKSLRKWVINLIYYNFLFLVCVSLEKGKIRRERGRTWAKERHW